MVHTNFSEVVKPKSLCKTSKNVFELQLHMKQHYIKNCKFNKFINWWIKAHTRSEGRRSGEQILNKSREARPFYCQCQSLLQIQTQKHFHVHLQGSFCLYSYSLEDQPYSTYISIFFGHNKTRNCTILVSTNKATKTTNQNSLKPEVLQKLASYCTKTLHSTAISNANYTKPQRFSIFFALYLNN